MTGRRASTTAALLMLTLLLTGCATSAPVSDGGVESSSEPEVQAPADVSVDAVLEPVDWMPDSLDVDTFAHYVSSLGDAYRGEYLYLPAHREIDWDNEIVVAVGFYVPDGVAFLRAGREEIDGELAYVIDLEGCEGEGSSSARMAFIPQTDREIRLPVYTRTVPSSAPCAE